MFRLKEKEEAVTIQGKLDTFLAETVSTKLKVLNVETVMAEVKSRHLSHELENLVEELLAQAGEKK